MGHLDPIKLYIWFLEPHESDLSGISIGSAVLHSSFVCATDKHTDTQTRWTTLRANVYQWATPMHGVHAMRLNHNHNDHIEQDDVFGAIVMANHRGISPFRSLDP